MKVMFIVGTLPPGRCGVGDYVHELAMAVAREFHQPAFAVSFDSTVQCRTFIDDGPTTESIGKGTGLGSLLRLLKQHKPDIVHLQFPSQGFYGRLLPSALPAILTLLRHRVVVTHHEIYRATDWRRAMLQSAGSRASIFVRPNFIEQCPKVVRLFLASKPWSFIRNASPLPPFRMTEGARKRLRLEYLRGRSRLLVFFGFVYPSKGVELLFQIGNPGADRILIAGNCPDEHYKAKINSEARIRGWNPSDYELLGFLDGQQASNLLAAADAVILPFTDGGGEWNTSIHGAVSQGTLVITTSRSKTGFDPDQNVSYREPGDVNGMKEDLDRWSGRRVPARDPRAEWREIAARHAEIYARATG
ncbi:glycosyltransferase [Hydrogenophaga sp. IBVHS2]|uniref:glycosyltransferase n=1 Tax=Hydrogenophaga sp. IBVHS2 TaxID=1985170 RepID=UPI00117B784C|nr:glycosyltransferase [Hydrogenophaga sp. IBVHS2]